MTTPKTAAEKIKRSGLIAIVRGGYSENQVIMIAGTLADAGISTLEVTLNSKGALHHIALLRKRFPQLLIGAGTVHNPAEVSSAVQAGAQFLVSPNLEAESVALSREAGVLHLPGVFTATEAQAAFAQGCQMVKLFPASVVGSNYLKALRAPLGHIGFVPTGGITPGSVADYVAAGAVALGVGSALVGAPGQEPSELTARANAFTVALSKARGGD